jgi:hypothetical protein
VLYFPNPSTHCFTEAGDCCPYIAIYKTDTFFYSSQSILLSPLELVELCETLAVLGKGVAFFHDPGMGTAKQGTMTKSLKAEPMPDGSGGVFLNLSTSTGAKLNVAVSFAEFCVLRNLTQVRVGAFPNPKTAVTQVLPLQQVHPRVQDCLRTVRKSPSTRLKTLTPFHSQSQYLVPRLMGFDEVFKG